MRTRFVLPVVAALVLLAFPMSGPAQAQRDSDEPDRPLGSVRSTECAIAVPETVGVDCGELVVPEDFDRPQGRRIRLPYIVVRARNTDPEPDPLIFTAGGPGDSSLDSVWRFADSRLLDDRDIIIFEQRGNRHAEPALLCELSVLDEERPGHTPCLDGIRAKGVDITQYTTDNIVRDVVALRKALGHEQWNLYGSSFSTSVMLLVMETDPSGTRSAILESVKPPNETTFDHEADSALLAIEQIFADCAADDRCVASYPNLAEDFFATVRRLNEAPVEIVVDGSDDREPVPLAVDGHGFIDWIVVSQLYGPVFPHHDAAYLPLLITEVNRGAIRPLEAAARSFWTSSVENGNWAWGLLFSINCQQDLPAADPTRPAADLAASERLDGFSRWASQRSICAAWGLAPQPPAATEYVRSDVPALVLAGSYDPVTPPSWSRATAEHLTAATYIEFPGRGHDVTTDNPCAATLATSFLADPTGNLDTSCVGSARGPSFVIADEVFRAPGLSRNGEEVSLGAAGGVAWLEAIAFVSKYGTFLLAAILLALGALWPAVARRRAGAADRTALLGYGLAALVTASTIAIAVLIAQLNDDYASRSDLAFSLGPSRDLASATLLAWISPLAGVVILALGGLTGWAWATGRWSPGFRVLTTISTVCSLATVVLGLRWGLFTMLL